MSLDHFKVVCKSAFKKDAVHSYGGEQQRVEGRSPNRHFVCTPELGNFKINVMTSENDSLENLAPGAIFLLPDRGRRYHMGSMSAVFKADENETQEKYSVSEWWLEPNSSGPGPHSHEANDEVFYVIEGTASLLVGVQWIEGGKGSFFLIPAKIIHDFRNTSNEKTGLLNFWIPGGFERNMEGIVKWFKENR